MRRRKFLVPTALLSTLMTTPIATALAADLPIREVILYKHGVGYFERSGQLQPGETAQLDFKAADMNDVLKSLTVTDRNGGKIGSVRYDASESLAKRLEDMKRRFACVGDVRYKGLFSVLELVKDKNTKEPLAPFNGTSPEMGALAAHLKSKHVYAFSRFNMLWVCPPLIINEAELKQGLDVIEEALAIVDAKLNPQSAAQPQHAEVAIRK